MQAQSTPTIPIARGGIINDNMLERLAAIGDQLQTGETISEEGGLLVISTFGAIAAELLQRRRCMRTIEDLSNMDNVVFLSPGTTPAAG